MTHIPGHIPKGTLVITDLVLKFEFHVHGYLNLAQLNENNEYNSTDFRILFLDNHQLLMDAKKKIKPEYGPIMDNEWKNMTAERQNEETLNRMVGFHLKLIEMPGTALNWGIAYDLVKWSEHQLTESCLQRIPRFAGKRVEDIDPRELKLLATNVEISKDDDDTKHILEEIPKSGNSDELIKNVVSILKQSANYMETDSYQKSKAGKNQYDWIINNVEKFDQLSQLFGVYKTNKLSSTS